MYIVRHLTPLKLSIFSARIALVNKGKLKQNLGVLRVTFSVQCSFQT